MTEQQTHDLNFQSGWFTVFHICCDSSLTYLTRNAHFVEQAMLYYGLRGGVR